MAEKYQSLLRIGPALGLDSTSAGEFVSPGDGVVASNIATYRYQGGLSTETGRTNIAVLQGLTGSVITAVAPYVASPLIEQYVLAMTNGASTLQVLLDPSAPTTPQVITRGVGFTQAVQFYNILYTNSGQQYSNQNPTNSYVWQYPAPAQAMYSVGQVAGTLPAGTYNYAFTWVTTTPGGQPQETTPIGCLPYELSRRYPTSIVQGQGGSNQGFPVPALIGYPYTVVSDGTKGAIVAAVGGFSGALPDGTTYTTNVYRQSSNVATWVLAANLQGAGPYMDNLTDTQIGANQQMLFNQDPPPVSAANPGSIFVHQERIFCFVQQQNNATFNQPQTQLWYSDLGTPWRFNSLAQQDGGQVLLVGNSTTPANASYLGYGDNPVQGVSLGGTAVLFKSRSTWVLFGNSSDTYFVSSLFNVGCMSYRSVIVAFGQVYWLSESGAYSYGGASPQYLSQKVRRTLEAIPFEDRCNAVSTFANLHWYLSFPATGITLAYYTVTGDWHTIPYATNAAAYTLANPRTYQGPFTTATTRPNEIVASRANTNPPALDWWFTGEADLGAPVTGTWAGPLMSSSSPDQQKIYRYLTVLAPAQPGTVTATLTIDPGGSEIKQFSVTFNLTAFGPQQETRHIAAISPDLRGYIAQLSLTFTNTLGQATPLIIYRADVWGTIDRQLVLPV